MIRPLSEINDEFRVEIAESPPPARGENDDVADLASFFGPEAEPKAEAKVETHRKSLRRVMVIVCALVAIILIIVAAVFTLNRPEISGSVNGTQDAEGAEDAESADVESEGQTDVAPGLGEDEYNSALENLEREIEDMRESKEEGADSGDAGAVPDEAPASGAAALYRELIALEYIDEAVSIAEPDALLSQENKRRLIERIDAHFSDRAGKDAPSLPTDEAINSDLEFTNLTEAANALVDAVNAGRESGSRLPEVIDLRTKAYSIYPLKVLKKLLAVDFEDFGLYCVAADRSAAEAFDSFISAVKYRTAYLCERPYGSDAYYAEIRRLGRLFAEIAEIGDADAAHKRHAELIATCLREMTAR